MAKNTDPYFYANNAEQFENRATQLATQLATLLHGKPPQIIAAALADCLARCLAGHVVPGDPAATRELREQLLTAFVDVVRDSIEPNAKQLGTWQA